MRAAMASTTSTGETVPARIAATISSAVAKHRSSGVVIVALLS
jgi:hypothetical protein